MKRLNCFSQSQSVFAICAPSHEQRKQTVISSKTAKMFHGCFSVFVLADSVLFQLCREL